MLNGACDSCQRPIFVLTEILKAANRINSRFWVTYSRRKREQNASNVKLASRRCKSCVFNGGFDIDELRRRWGRYSHQTCHQFRIAGERRATHPDVWCRGYWDKEADPKFKEFVTAVGLVEIVEQNERE
jgi:hypothetical protein